MLSVIMLTVIMLNFIMLTVIMLNFIMLSVVMLSVEIPLKLPSKLSLKIFDKYKQSSLFYGGIYCKKKRFTKLTQNLSGFKKAWDKQQS